MRVRILSLLLIFSASMIHSFENKIVTIVGDIAITTYDIDQMRGFEKLTTGSSMTSSAALTRLINMASLLTLAQSYPDYAMSEVELRKSINTLTNTSDGSAKQRIEVLNKYESIYRMYLRADKVKKNLIGGNLQIRTAMNENLSENQMKAFYNQNKANFKDSPYPKLDLIVFGVEISPKWTLSDLENVESELARLAKTLDSSNNVSRIRRDFGKSLRFTAYSGRTELLSPEVLILQKKLPEEVIGIALRDEIPLGPNPIKIQRNKGIYIPQPIPMQSTGKPTYIVLKVLNIEQPQQLSFEDAKPRIEEILRYQKGEAAIDQMIKDRINQGQITLTPIDSSFNKVFRTFNK
ncbi:MAG: hypothetical protein ACRCS8_01025 [Brevinema sp.]